MPSSCESLTIERNSAMSPEQIKQMEFPHFASGEVVKGFGRGSKELGIPTANFPEHVVDELPQAYSNGVYFGWAQVENGPVYKMVMSIGNNPYYHNVKRTMETHVMHVFDSDFYGSNLKVVMLGYLRPMTDFKCLDDLISAINKDISDADKALELAENKIFQTHSYFSKPIHKL